MVKGELQPLDKQRAHAQTINWQSFGRTAVTLQSAERVLAAAVDAAGRVDYAALQSRDLAAAAEAIAAADLSNLSELERYAFLLNAYNLSALILAKRLLWRNGTTKTLANPLRWLWFFMVARVRVAGRSTSLLGLEFLKTKAFLRRDPRGHFALVCASAGCPPLRGGIYHGETLDGELDAAATAFLQPGAGYRLDRGSGRLHLSRIFRWYRRDFAAVGGPLEVFLNFAPKDDADWVRRHRPRISYLRYDWTLNMQSRLDAHA